MIDKSEIKPGAIVTTEHDRYLVTNGVFYNEGYGCDSFTGRRWVKARNCFAKRRSDCPVEYVRGIEGADAPATIDPAAFAAAMDDNRARSAEMDRRNRAVR